MLHGAVTGLGLLPRDSPIFFTYWLELRCDETGKPRKTLDGDLYKDYIENYFKPLVEQDIRNDGFNPDDFVFQDDGDSKHRKLDVQETMVNLWEQRVPPPDQVMIVCLLYKIVCVLIIHIVA